MTVKYNGHFIFNIMSKTKINTISNDYLNRYLKYRIEINKDKPEIVKEIQHISNIININCNEGYDDFPLGIKGGCINIITCNQNNDNLLNIIEITGMHIKHKHYKGKNFITDLNRLSEIGNGVIILTRRTNSQLTLNSVKFDFMPFINLIDLNYEINCIIYGSNTYDYTELERLFILSKRKFVISGIIRN